jgi:RND superfamily putative drug exporter
VYTLTGGTVPGQGAVVWSTQAASALRRTPAPSAPVHIDRLSAAPTVQLARTKRWVVLDDNSRFEIDRDCVIGRDPRNSDAARRGLRPVRIDDRTSEMSRAHIEIRFVNGEVVIFDRNSTNGVLVREPAQQGWTRLAPWEPAKWLPGAYVRIGSRTLQLQELTAPRPQRRPHVHVGHDMSNQLHDGPADAAAIAKPLQ